MLPGDLELIQIVDAAVAESARKSGHWLVCRPGCSQCCYGAFAIGQLDAHRLRQGLRLLDQDDPERAARVRDRARFAAARIPSGAVPDDYDDDEPCPVLDPETGTCDLYAWRPITCRTFGPPVSCGDDAVGVCELCFEGATDEQIAECEVELDIDDLETKLVQELEQATGAHGNMLVAFALTGC
ncbi:MAG: YkgJ family cysteine cluster protein [Bryobacteraceae bacterium]